MTQNLFCSYFFSKTFVNKDHSISYNMTYVASHVISQHYHIGISSGYLMLSSYIPVLDLVKHCMYMFTTFIREVCIVYVYMGTYMYSIYVIYDAYECKILVLGIFKNTYRIRCIQALQHYTVFTKMEFQGHVKWQIYENKFKNLRA